LVGCGVKDVHRPVGQKAGDIPQDGRERRVTSRFNDRSGERGGAGKTREHVFSWSLYHGRFGGRPDIVSRYDHSSDPTSTDRRIFRAQLRRQDSLFAAKAKLGLEAPADPVGLEDVPEPAKRPRLDFDEAPANRPTVARA